MGALVDEFLREQSTRSKFVNNTSYEGNLNKVNTSFKSIPNAGNLQAEAVKQASGAISGKRAVATTLATMAGLYGADILNGVVDYFYPADTVDDSTVDGVSDSSPATTNDILPDNVDLPNDDISFSPHTLDLSGEDTLFDILKAGSNAEGMVANALQNANYVTSLYSSKILEALSDINDTLLMQSSIMAEEYALKVKPEADPSSPESTSPESTADDDALVIELNDTTIDKLSNGLSDVGVTLKNSVSIDRSEDEISLTKKKLDHVTFETTPIQLDNIGDNIPEATPQAMNAINNAVTAKLNSDKNTISLDPDDIDDMMGGFDISSIFNFERQSEWNLFEDDGGN